MLDRETDEGQGTHSALRFLAQPSSEQTTSPQLAAIPVRPTLNDGGSLTDEEIIRSPVNST